MKSKYYQVGKVGPWMIDHPDGRSINYRPGQVFEAKPTNKSVGRGLRLHRLRELSAREAGALEAAKVVKIKADAAAAAKPKAMAPNPAPKPTVQPVSQPKPDSGE